MLPTQLTEIFEDYEGDYSLFISKVDFTTDTLCLTFELRVPPIYSDKEIFQRWLVKALGHRSNHIKLGKCDFINISKEDPLLWKFTDSQSELYYNGKVTNPTKLFTDLLLVHRKNFDHYLPFSFAFQTFPYSNGLLAKGPRKLMEQYAECLKECGLKSSIVGDRRPTYWDGYNHIPEKENLKIMFLSDSYIIAEDFLLSQY